MFYAKFFDVLAIQLAKILSTSRLGKNIQYSDRKASTWRSITIILYILYNNFGGEWCRKIKSTFLFNGFCEIIFFLSYNPIFSSKVLSFKMLICDFVRSRYF